MYTKRNNNILEIISLYSGNYKKEFYLRQIASISKIPLKTVQEALKELENLNIIKSETRGKNKYFKLNLDNASTKFYLLESEINKTLKFIANHDELNLFLKQLNGEERLIVFGSYAKANENKHSDLDMLVICEKDHRLAKELIPIKVQEIRLKKESFTKGLKENEPLIQEIKENHVILNNHSFFIDLFWENERKRY